MAISFNNSISDLIIVRRLMISTRQVEARREGKEVNEQTAKDAYEEGQAFVSGKAHSAECQWKVVKLTKGSSS